MPIAEADDKLYRLIHSLDKFEKGFVKKYAVLHAKEDANSKRLFDVYNNVKPYDKEKIEKLVKKEKFAKHLAKSKNYLLNLILKALRIYSAENNTKNKIRALIIDAEILKEKRLYKEAFSVIARAKKEALKTEVYRLLLDVIFIEQQLYPNVYVDNTLYAEQDRKYMEEDTKYREMEIAVRYLDSLLPDIINWLYNIPKSDKKENQKKINDLLNSAEYKNAIRHDANSYRFFHQYYTVFAHYINEDFVAFNKKGRDLIALLHDPKKLPPFSNSALISFFDNIGCLALTIPDKKLYEECYISLQKIKNKTSKTDSHAHVMASNCIEYLFCNYCLVFGQFEEGLKLCKQHLSVEDISDDALSSNLAIVYYYHSAFLFLTGKYSEAIKSVNKIELFAQHDNLYHISELFLIRILSHLELNHFETAQNIAEKYLLFIEKSNLNFNQRKLLAQLLSGNAGNNKNEIAKQLIRGISEKKLPKENCMDIALIDLSAWAQSR
jgi:hypothetical protein